MELKVSLAGLQYQLSKDRVTKHASQLFGVVLRDTITVPFYNECTITIWN